MWNLPGLGIEPVSPASAGRFFITSYQRSPTVVLMEGLRSGGILGVFQSGESTEFADGLDMQENVGCEQLEKYT